jgi:putative ABC transport system permease protein
MAAQPETDQTTLVTAAPLGDGVSATRYAVAPQIWFRATNVDANFFSTLRIPIVAGRAFEPGDDEKNAVMVSKRGALEMFGTLDVVGRGFQKGRTSPKVVGVAADARLSNIQATDMAELYWPLRPGQANAMIVRAKTDPSRLLVPLRDAARVADERVLPAVRLMRDDFERELRTPRLASGVAAVTALLALGLACVGIFGVVSYGVGLRTKEIGIRLALGADAGSILRALLRYTLWSGAVGVLVGLAGGWPAGRTFAGAPFYLQHLDLAAYASVGVIFVVTGIIAAFVPAWRALRRDPLQALRHE